MISPCVSLCEVDRDTGLCLGCARSMEEKRQWKDPATTDKWKMENLNECKDRMNNVQLDYWKKSYDFKTKTGQSMYKYGKELRNET